MKTKKPSGASAGKTKKTRSGPHPRSERMRQEIVMAAAEAFAKKGYRATTMQEIAAAAGYTAASLYTYFKSKEEIFRAIVKNLKADLLGTYRERLPAGLSFAQRLELLLLRQYELSERRKTAIQLILSTTSEVAPEELSPASDGHKAFCDAFEAWMAEHASPKDLGGATPQEAARVLMGISHAFFQDWILGRLDGRLSDAAPRVVSYFLHGIAGDRS